MSLILEALKKVERQHLQNRTPLAVCGTTSVAPQVKRWPILMITGVIAMMMFGLGAILARQEAASGSMETAALPEGRLAMSGSGTKVNQAKPVESKAVDEFPESYVGTSVISDEMSDESHQSAGSGEIHETEGTALSDESVVQFADLPADVRSSLPPLKVDVHYYQELPKKRFVMIDQHRYVEGDRLISGPLLVEITNSGVILKHRGHRFILSRL